MRQIYNLTNTLKFPHVKIHLNQPFKTDEVLEGKKFYYLKILISIYSLFVYIVIDIDFKIYNNYDNTKKNII